MEKHLMFTDMSYMFSGCYSLLSLPDISKLKTSKFNIMNKYSKHV